MRTLITLTDIAQRGHVLIEHDAARGVPKPVGYSITVKLGDRFLIGTCVGASDELDQQLGVVAGRAVRDRVSAGAYLSAFSPLEIMGLRGDIAARIERQDWSV